MMKVLKTLVIPAFLCLSAAVQAAGNGVMVENPWIREAPPTSKAMAGYMVVHNHGEQERALVAAQSPAYDNVMLHKTIVEDGLAKMVHQMKVTIPAGGSVTFEPKGYHLMLMKPKQALKAGEKVPVTLEFADGEKMELMYEVRASGSMGGMSGGKMDHSSMGH
ncbi:copper chaperone PCu(A)C [Thiohalomonas denitrificans]|uniref:copper chaperone PCu(A)C n=1 Tax=Thiohalomonas denitrificans TaxID=415747 RepID=UPI0026EF96BC|nr:copper chaperone PCu(A)C [Thiohalomonas denitrificans]